MIKIPDQAKVFILLLAFYCWPFLFSLSFSDEMKRYELIFYIVLQYAVVMCCYKITREKWVGFVILVEASAAMWNLFYFFSWNHVGSVFDANYNAFMFCAFVLELLILNISLRTENGRSTRPNSSSPNFTFMCRLNHQDGLPCSKEAYQ